jgi:hypothetical protein
MKYYLLILVFACISCSSAKKAMYESSPNDVAKIDLVLQKNKNFIIHFKDLEEKPPKTYQFKGNWKENGDYIKLIFKLDKDDLPDLKALFDPALDESKSVRILDKSTVEFKKNSKKIKIWGLSCLKVYPDASNKN